ncbi:hypothetical protein GGTG_00017 [Gaeumannomyces tritici R3-111a-1]|uniref:Transmembrane protein n=1 Tax=Gaeumannomyces tritici (strain R3-111a-1) TaxID=644352 RepID=J3NFH1_GAET3|nr:hypothetical protein GGTG_00017 [Gaeumannomyces tritici R3-111a-1]EJT80011.1 hypothetical protein GGTG_00017 [Gaeumannomyces tritici R3-111a-1]
MLYIASPALSYTPLQGLEKGIVLSSAPQYILKSNCYYIILNLFLYIFNFLFYLFPLYLSCKKIKQKCIYIYIYNLFTLFELQQLFGVKPGKNSFPSKYFLFRVVFVNILRLFPPFFFLIPYAIPPKNITSNCKTATTITVPAKLILTRLLRFKFQIKEMYILLFEKKALQTAKSITFKRLTLRLTVTLLLLTFLLKCFLYSISFLIISKLNVTGLTILR